MGFLMTGRKLLQSKEGSLFAGTSLAAFILYGLTAAPRITLMDAGDLIMGAQTLGVVHPPGYPLYTLLGFLFSKLLFFLDPAQQIHLFSSLWGALSVGVLALILWLLLASLPLALFGACTYALSGLVWAQATVAEVYTLHAFLTALILYFLLLFRQFGQDRYFYLVCLITGLALANSYPLILLAGLGLIWLIPWSRLNLALVLKGLLCLGLGLLPYLYLFIQARRQSELAYVFFDLGSPSMVLDYISRSHYSIVDGKTATLMEKAEVLLMFLASLSESFVLACLPLAWGFYRLFQSRSFLRFPLIVAIASSSVLLFGLLGTKPEEGSFAGFSAYTLPSMLFLSIVIAYGVQAMVAHWLVSKPLALALALFCLLLQGVSGFYHASHHNNDAVEAWADNLLRSLPPQSSLLFCGDESFALQYMQLVKGLRPDVQLYVRYFADGVPMLYQRGPDVLASLQRNLRWQDFIKETTKPVYFTHCWQRFASAGISFENKGLAYQIHNDHSQDQQGLPLTQQGLHRLLDSLLSSFPKADYWMDLFRHRQLRILLGYGLKEKIISKADSDQLISSYAKDSAKLKGALAAELAAHEDFDLALAYFSEVQPWRWPDLQSSDLEIYCRLLLFKQQTGRARQVCQQVIAQSSHCNGDAYYNLGMAYWQDKAKSLAYFEQALHCLPNLPAAKAMLTKRQQEP